MAFSRPPHILKHDIFETPAFKNSIFETPKMAKIWATHTKNSQNLTHPYLKKFIPYQKNHPHTPNSGIFETPYKKWHFQDPKYHNMAFLRHHVQKWHFRDTTLKNGIFKPKHSKKWHFQAQYTPFFLFLPPHTKMAKIVTPHSKILKN